jgi:hypothetical protein
LAANQAISFIGSYILGMGFTMSPEEAETLIRRNRRNREVLFPYLNGQDLNSRPDCSASRWVINFFDWSAERAQQFPEVFEIVECEVRPERQRRKPDGSYALRKPLPDRYWHYADKRPALYRSIAGLERVVVITLVSRTMMPVMVPTKQVFAHKLAVFATDDSAMLAMLSCAHHYFWAMARTSTRGIGNAPNYSPSDAFETLPLPTLTSELRELGERLDTCRRDVMLSLHAGLTATYNLVFDLNCQDQGIAELRRIHREIDEAVCRAYGWDDLVEHGLDHGYHDLGRETRYTIGPVVRQEILNRLLELNHERYEAEVAAGLHDKKKAKRKPTQEGLFDG